MDKSSNSQILVKDARFNVVEDRLAKMYERAMEFCQSRSKHQLAKFVCYDEHTLITRYRHMSHNSYVTMQEIRRMLIDRERSIRKLQKLQKRQAESKDLKEDDIDLDIYELSRQLEESEIRIKGLLKEVDYMEAICDELEKQNGKPFTAEQWEAEEPEYWRKRFARQMHNAQIGNKLGIGEGNYMSYLMSLEKSPLNDGQEIRPINLGDINEIAMAALEGRPGIEENMLVAKPPVEHKEIE